MKIGQKIDRLYELKLEKAELNRQIAAIEAVFDTIQAEVLAELQEEGVSTMKATRAGVTVKSSTVGTVEDWDAFYQYVLDTQQPFLLERRISVTAYRDLLAAGEDVPGVKPFTKVELALRKM